MKRMAEITAELGPFAGITRVHGVGFDGKAVWFASGDRIIAIDPDSGVELRAIAVAAHAGTTFDGQHLYQIAEDVIQKIDPETGAVLTTIPTPSSSTSGLAWAEGSLWVGDYRNKAIHQVDPGDGRVLRTIASDRFVTGVTWSDGELWHATLEDGASELRHIDAGTGAVIEQLEMPQGAGISGLDTDGGDRFFCGSAGSSAIRVVRKPRR